MDLNVKGYYKVPLNNIKERRRHLVKHIEDLVLQMIQCISQKEKPRLSYNDGKNSGWTNKNMDSNINSLEAELNNNIKGRLKILKFSGYLGRQRFAVIMRIMCYVHSNLVKNLNKIRDEFYCTKRAFYYNLKNEYIKRFIGKQQRIEWAIHEMTMLLECGPWELGFISTSKGLVAGDLSIKLGQAKVVNYEPSSCYAVPDVIANITQIYTRARFVLVVEKDSVFQKLLREKCPAFNNCILITGKGYPDISTRMFIHMLSEKAQLPTYALVDANPHGFDIMCVYRFGTLNNLGYRKELICPSMRWLGVHQHDLNLLGILKIKLTKNDMKKIADIQKRSYIDTNFSKHLMEMKLGKAEIESINKPLKRFLTELFIPAKIRKKECI